MISRIDSVERIERSASFRTSDATTAKPLPGLPGARGLDRGVQRQQVRLLGDLVDQLEDLADLLRPLAERQRPLGNRLDLLLHVAHRVAGLLCGRRDGAGVVGDRRRRRRQLLDRRRRLGDRRRSAPPSPPPTPAPRLATRSRRRRARATSCGPAGSSTPSLRSDPSDALHARRSDARGGAQRATKATPPRQREERADEAGNESLRCGVRRLGVALRGLLIVEPLQRPERLQHVGFTRVHEAEGNQIGDVLLRRRSSGRAAALRERRDECIVRMPRLRDDGGLRRRASRPRPAVASLKAACWAATSVRTSGASVMRYSFAASRSCQNAVAASSACRLSRGPSRALSFMRSRAGSARSRRPLPSRAARGSPMLARTILRVGVRPSAAVERAAAACLSSFM